MLYLCTLGVEKCPGWCVVSYVVSPQTKCFICGIGSDYFDTTPHGFETHTFDEHNLANYMYCVFLAVTMATRRTCRDMRSEINSLFFLGFFPAGSSSCTSSTRTRQSTPARWVPTFYIGYSERILASASMAMPRGFLYCWPALFLPPVRTPGR